MLECFIESRTKSAIPIIPLTETNYPLCLKRQSNFLKNWLKQNHFQAKSGEVCLLPDSEGNLEQVVFGMAEQDDCWVFGKLPFLLPERTYYLAEELHDHISQLMAIIWGLGAYQ